MGADIPTLIQRIGAKNAAIRADTKLSGVRKRDQPQKIWYLVGNLRFESEATIYALLTLTSAAHAN